MQRVIRRESGADLEIGDDPRIEPLGELDASRPGVHGARGPPRQDHDPAPAAKHGTDPIDRFQRGSGRNGWGRPAHIEEWERHRHVLFLQRGIQHNICRPLRGGVGDPEGAGHRFARGLGTPRLVIPFGVTAHDCGLVARGVDPIDPWPALGGINRTGGADHQHRHAVAPGIEYGHRGVEEANVGMDGGGHRATRHLGVAMRDGDGRLLVQAQQKLRILVAEIIDERIVQSAKARARIDGYVGDFERAQRLGYGVAAKLGRVAVDPVGARALDCRRAAIPPGVPLRTQASILPDQSSPRSACLGIASRSATLRQ